MKDCFAISAGSVMKDCFAISAGVETSVWRMNDGKAYYSVATEGRTDG